MLFVDKERKEPYGVLFYAISLLSFLSGRTPEFFVAEWAGGRIEWCLRTLSFNALVAPFIHNIPRLGWSCTRTALRWWPQRSVGYLSRERMTWALLFPFASRHVLRRYTPFVNRFTLVFFHLNCCSGLRKDSNCRRFALILSSLISCCDLRRGREARSWKIALCYLPDSTVTLNCVAVLFQWLKASPFIGNWI